MDGHDNGACTIIIHAPLSCYPLHNNNNNNNNNNKNNNNNIIIVHKLLMYGAVRKSFHIDCVSVYPLYGYSFKLSGYSAVKSRL